MERARYDDFMARWNALKKNGCKCHSNIFQDASSLEKKLTEKKCILHMSDQNLYLFVPRHDFYDMLYVICDSKTFIADMDEVFANWQIPQAIRASVIGTEPGAGAMAENFEEAGFELSKKLLRMRSGGGERTSEGKATVLFQDAAEKKSIKTVQSIMAMFAEENRPYMFIAQPEDAPELLEILKQTFDPIGDNLPELDEIREAINSGGVAVLRMDGKIASFVYQEIRSGIGYGYYDVTRPEYRGANGYGPSLSIFLTEENAKRGRVCNRWITWRPADDPKLLKYANKTNEKPEGIVLYNMRWPRLEKDKCCA